MKNKSLEKIIKNKSLNIKVIFKKYLKKIKFLNKLLF